MFTHLHVHSPCSFLDGAGRIDDLVARAGQLGMTALALTDHNNLSAAVRFHKAATAAGLQPILGAEVTLTNGHHLTLLAQNADGYANLCRILTHAHLSRPRLEPGADPEFIRRHAEHLIALSGCRRGEIPHLLWQRRFDEARAAAERYRDIFGADRFFLELQADLLPGARGLHRHLAQLGEHLGLGLVATNNVHYADPAGFPAHDVLTCVRTLTKLEDIHPERKLNAENYLCSEAEMAARLADYPAALRQTAEIAARCEPSLRPGEYLFPVFAAPPGETARGYLRKLAYAGALRRRGKVDEKARRRLDHELGIIHQLGFDEYFLAVWDMVNFARGRGIRFAGRGSAADSFVAYCLGITQVDSLARGLLFERFLNPDRANLPDIDVDFQAERRDEVTEYAYEKYGRDHVATVCTFNTFHARSAVRDVGKALGFPEGEIDRLAKLMPYLEADAIAPALDRVPELRDSAIPRHRYELLLRICAEIAGFPRFLGTHLGGIVISRRPLTEISPLQLAAKGVTVIQFDKDDVEDLGLAKLDLLSLRMLTAIENTVTSVNRERPQLDYDAIPLDDPAAFDLIRSTETTGLFQLESPAQKSLHGRLCPETFEDIVASVALIRPGPVQADMVAPFINRRQGKEPITYLHPALEPILAKTYGVVLYQEQVIEIAIAVAGFTPGEADQLRRVMTHHRSHQEMARIGEQFIRRCLEKGIDQPTAQEIFSYIQAYAGYGFCEAHAANFGDTAYRTAYLMAHHPAEFYAGLLSCQPMGYYPPHTLVLEAQRKGIRVLPPDINRSGPQWEVQEGALRVALTQVKGMSEAALQAIVAARSEGAFTSLVDFCRRTRVNRDIVENLILCGAMEAIPDHGNRKRLIWQLAVILESVIDAEPGTLGLGSGEAPPVSPDLPDFTAEEKQLHELEILGIGVNCHPVSCLRRQLAAVGALTSREIKRIASGKTVRAAGVVVRPHRPPTRSGRTVVFVTLEDEHGLLDVTIFESVYQKYGKVIFTRPVLLVEGRAERRGQGVSIIASRVAGFPRAPAPRPAPGVYAVTPLPAGKG